MLINIVHKKTILISDFMKFETVIISWQFMSLTFKYNFCHAIYNEMKTCDGTGQFKWKMSTEVQK